MITKIENDRYDEIEKAAVALIDFSAVWCGPCRMIAPIVEELSDEMDGTAEFFNIDVDDNPVLAGRFGIQSIPSLILTKNGKPVASKVGFMPKEQLKAWIEANI